MSVVEARLEECEYMGFNYRLGSFKDGCRDLVLAKGGISSFKYSFIDVYNYNKQEVDLTSGYSR